jgi:hypothetical protein
MRSRLPKGVIIFKMGTINRYNNPQSDNAFCDRTWFTNVFNPTSNVFNQFKKSLFLIFSQKIVVL